MISRRIAIEMGYDEDDVKTIMLAGLVHDLDEVITGDIPTPTKMRAKAQGVDLNDNGIEARPFFYLLSDMDIYKKYSHTINSSAKKISSCGINLPTYESLMSLDQIELIIKKIIKGKK